jgi:hypothetical protein
LSSDRGARRRVIATAAGLAVGATAYLVTLLDYSPHLTRTANALGYASNFFDFQARSLLDGRLDVPSGSLGIEGFIEQGKEYMYFAPLPALLRMPVLSTTTEYDGKLTLLSMALAFVLMLVMTAKLTWLVRDTMYPDTEVTRLEAACLGVFLALATGGTSLTFIASLPWVYHEVYAWAVPLAIGAMYWMIRLLRSPSATAVGWLIVFDLGAVMTRTTGGWAVCLLTIVAGVWLLTGRLHAGQRRIGGAVVLGAAAALLAGILVNWLKFRHPFLFPLGDQVWTALNERRREALDANGGTITGPQFFPTAFMAYFRIDGIRFVDYFPWITLPAHPAPAYDGAFVDQSYRTGSVTSFMPWLLATTVLAAITLFRPGVDVGRRILRVPLVTGVVLTAGVMAYGYFAMRYTAEFVPALVMGGSVGTCALAHWLQRRHRAVLAAGLAVLTAATAYSIAAFMLVGYSTAAATAGGPSLERYLTIQHDLDPQAQKRLITTSDQPPTGGSADDIWIAGDCDSLWLNSGDQYDPWLLVERRSTVVTARLDEDVQPGRVELVRIETNDPRSVWLQVNRHDQARVQLVNETGAYNGPWFDLLEPREVRVGVRDRPELGYAEVSSNPGGWAGYLRAFEYDHDWISHPISIGPVAHDAASLASRGIHLTTEAGIDPPLCHALRSQVDSAHGTVARAR